MSSRPSYLAGVFFLIWILLSDFGGKALLPTSKETPAGNEPNQIDLGQSTLSPFWGAELQERSAEITELAEVYGLHPDFIAAVLEQNLEETIDNPFQMNSLGLNGWRPKSSVDWLTARSPSSAVSGQSSRWTMDILTFAIQQSGGDLSTALAVYNGGWSHANESIAREYASRVLDRFGRALLARQGISASPSTKWTIAIQSKNGNIPQSSYLFVGSSLPAGAWSYADVLVYSAVDRHDRPMYLRGMVVPLSPVEFAAGGPEDFPADQLEIQLQARLGNKNGTLSKGNFRFVIACLPTLARLQRQTTTRWYAPTSCPPNNRE